MGRREERGTRKAGSARRWWLAPDRRPLCGRLAGAQNNRRALWGTRLAQFLHPQPLSSPLQVPRGRGFGSCDVTIRDAVEPTLSNPPGNGLQAPRPPVSPPSQSSATGAGPARGRRKGTKRGPRRLREELSMNGSRRGKGPPSRATAVSPLRTSGLGPESEWGLRG